jgi:hypothetical protein
MARTPASSPTMAAGARAGMGGRRRDAHQCLEPNGRCGRTKWSPGSTPVTTGAAATGDSRRGGKPEREGEGEEVQEDGQLTRSMKGGSARPGKVKNDGIDSERSRGQRARGGRL